MFSDANSRGMGSNQNERHLSREENKLLTEPLPHDVNQFVMAELWERYQHVIGQLLIRMGAENSMLDSIARVPWVSNADGLYARLALIPQLGLSALNVLRKNRLSEFTYRVAGECSLMELSAAAGYRTFCFPPLVAGLAKTGKMRDRPVRRMLDTFEFLSTMCQKGINDPAVIAHLERTNGLHKKYKVAGSVGNPARDLFKYIALNMFYIGPSMRPDLSPEERHAICGLTVLVSKKMGHELEGSVRDFDEFIAAYEAKHMFHRNDESPIRQKAVEIAQASKAALDYIPVISPARIHGYVPHHVKKILRID